MGLSRRAYARHRGITENAVRNAISTGRITLEPDGTIDPEKADAQWATRTDPSFQRVFVKTKPAEVTGPKAAPLAKDEKQEPKAAVEAVKKVLRDGGEKTEGELNFHRARTANEVIKAQERSLRLAKIKGELVDKAKAVAVIFGLARRERDAWTQWPARVAAIMANELRVDPHVMETVLDKHVRAHLSELSEVKIDLR